MAAKVDGKCGFLVPLGEDCDTWLVYMWRREYVELSLLGYIQGSFSIRRDIDKYARISFEFSYELETIGNSLERETLCLLLILFIR